MELRIIPWVDFQIGIAPLWKADKPFDIPIINNPFRIISYPLEQWPDRILYFPCKLVQDSETVAYTSIYNISDSVTRIRGIYTVPEFRGLGYGHIIWQKAAELFPSSFYRTVGFWREGPAERFLKYSDMSIVPNTDWFWSDFSQCRMRFLYKDRCSKSDDISISQTFIQNHIERFGFGGTNNLNRAWSSEEWIEFSQPHAETYLDAGLKF